MANTYSSTVLNNARLWQLDTMKEKFDQRADISQVYKCFEDGQRFIPDLEKIKAAYVQTEQTMYLPNKNFTLGTAKSCTVTGETGSSAVVALTWAQLNFNVLVQHKKYQNNELGLIKALANDMYQGERSLWKGSTGMEALMVAYLNTNRTYVNALSAGTSGTKNSWSGAANYYVEVTNANRGQFWNYMRADMEYNDYEGKLWDIGNTWFGADMNYYAAQGQGNSTNTAFQFSNSEIEFLKTTKIAPSGYHDSIHYIVPEGGVASLFWNDPLNRKGENIGDKAWFTMESMMYPGVYYDVFKTLACSDTSADGGSTQDLVENYEFTLNYSFTKQPLSTTNETPIYKYNILSS